MSNKRKLSSKKWSSRSKRVITAEVPTWIKIDIEKRFSNVRDLRDRKNPFKFHHSNNKPRSPKKRFSNVHDLRDRKNPFKFHHSNNKPHSPK